MNIYIYIFTHTQYNNNVSMTEKAQANEQRYTKLKEKYSELVQSHADLLRKVRKTSSTNPRNTNIPV